ncbi:hypothetical protein GCM10009789_15390 [Kribbella sancticallisti]|uniref:Uncharacterized protein n=1 Tax=Kribbella sancticallisti TaxID=460087 RepID=A0ABN2CVP9_9ACTN
MTIPRAAAAGSAFGLAWGAAARVWMRLISTDPEFTWTGTGVILASTSVCGLVLGFLYGVRRAGWSRWWRLLSVVWLFVFAGPGFVFLPAFLLGGLLHLHRLHWKLLGAAAVVSGVVLLWRLNQQEPAGFDPVLMYGGFLLLSLALTAGAAEIYRPRGRGKSTPVRVVDRVTGGG